jgi:hypothetical protein
MHAVEVKVYAVLVMGGRKIPLRAWTVKVRDLDPEGGSGAASRAHIAAAMREAADRVEAGDQGGGQTASGSVLVDPS